MVLLLKETFLLLLLGSTISTLHHLYGTARRHALFAPRRAAVMVHHQPIQNLLLAERGDRTAGSEDVALGASSAVIRCNTTANDTLTASFPSTMAPFPRWSGSIGVESLVEVIQLALDGKFHYDRVHRVYIIDDKAQLWHAEAPRDSSLDQAPTRRGDRMEKLAVQTLQLLTRNPNATAHVYPHFWNAVQNQGGFAYVANFADSTFCAGNESPFVDATKKKVVTNAAVPIFTLSAPVDCALTFPVPTYETIKHAVKPWSLLVPRYRQRYPWESKERRAVWRGTPTGDKVAGRNLRIQLCDRAQQRPNLLDAHLTKCRRTGFEDIDESQFLGERVPMQEFQKYRAIVDVDGHSWSSRFGELLCYSSVVLKIEPSHVDYFQTELQPWVHYIPVKADMSDLYDMVEFAVSDEHEDEVHDIIHNANAWCVRRLNPESLVHDLAEIWDRYASHLQQVNGDDSWREAQKDLLGNYSFKLLD